LTAGSTEYLKERKMNIEQVSPEQELKEHYVYELQDPRDDTVFYVGKGTGRRAEHHVKEAMKEDEREKAKLAKIREIRARGQTPKEVVIARFDTEAEAFAVEAVLIHWVYGHPDDCEDSTLTNIQGGHGRDTIRNKDDYDEIQGIDIPKPERSNDGTYTNQKIEKNERHDVENKLAALRKFVIQHHPEWAVSDVNMSHPMSPSICIEVAGAAKIECVLPGSRTGRLKINIRAAMNNKESIEQFRILVEGLGDKTKGIKNYPNHPYCKLRLEGFEDSIHIDQEEEILHSLKLAWDLIESTKLPLN